jgi:hypothetical protein
MNGDGVPEILHERESLDDSGKSVLEVDTPRTGWQTVARSACGTTA